MKKIFAIVAALVLCLSIFTFASADDAVRVYALKGPTGIGMVKMMNDNDGSLEFTLCGAPDEAVAAIVSGSADIAAVPTNLAATLFQKTDGGVQMLALNTLGVLSILENGTGINNIEDLAGKTIYATGQGSTPEYVLNYILETYGLSDQVEVVYYAEHAELATLAAAGKADIVMLPEPHTTSVLMQNSSFRVALDVTSLYESAAEKNGITGAALSMGCIIARTEFIRDNPGKIADFLDKYGKSVEFVNNNTSDAASMVESQGIMPKAKVAEKAIPNCHIVFITGNDMVNAIKPFFNLLFEANPKSVGGKLPDDSLYFVNQ